MNITSYIVIMAVCVILSAYFSATETAFSSLNKTRLKALCEKGNKKAGKALALSENYDKLISTILIGNNIVNIGAASCGTVMFVHLYGDVGASISTAVVTIIVLIFGEISPKSIAKDCPEKFAMFSTPLISALIKILTPLNFVFSVWKKLLSRIFKFQDNTKMSQEELIMLVDEVTDDGALDDDEGDLIKNAIEFADRHAEDILTHRVDIEAVSINDSNEEIAKKFAQTQLSRLLVYDESIDNIVGVCHLKDFFDENGITKKSIKEVMTPPFFIQKSEELNDLLKKLQANKSHIAVVVDEYGGTLGIVTMEDILEEIVGDIWDEHDEVEEEFKKIGDNTYIVDCSVNFDDFCEFFNIKYDSESISVGGWIMELFSTIPELNAQFNYENLEIKIIEKDNHRIVKIKVTVNEDEHFGGNADE